MIKAIEKADGRSCWNKADQNEMVFVLLGRDRAAPATIRAWITERLRLGLNTAGDSQLTEAEQCARFIVRVLKTSTADSRAATKE